MKQMQEPDKPYTLRHHLTAVGRDVLTIAAVVSLLSGVFWAVARPYIAPYLELPTYLTELQLDITQMQLDLAEIRTPKIVDFSGPGIVITEKPIKPGGFVTIIYNLRRNASCVTDIDVRFINVNTGTKEFSHTMRAIQAPVTKDFDSFLLRLKVPETLAPGTYSYHPRLHPIDCGVYSSYNGAITTPFVVEK